MFSHCTEPFRTPRPLSVVVGMDVVLVDVVVVVMVGLGYC